MVKPGCRLRAVAVRDEEQRSNARDIREDRNGHGTAEQCELTVPGALEQVDEECGKREQCDERVHAAAGQPDGEGRVREMYFRADPCDRDTEQPEQRRGVACRERLELVAQQIQELGRQWNSEYEVRDRKEQRTHHRFPVKEEDQAAEREEEREGHEEGEDSDESDRVDEQASGKDNKPFLVWCGIAILGRLKGAERVPGEEARNEENEEPVRVIRVVEPGAGKPGEDTVIQDREDEQDKHRDLWDLHRVPLLRFKDVPTLFHKDISLNASFLITVPCSLFLYMLPLAERFEYLSMQQIAKITAHTIPNRT